MEFNLLTKKQIDNMQLFKDYGKQAMITDYAIALDGKELGNYGYYYLQKKGLSILGDQYRNEFINNNGEYECSKRIIPDNLGIRPVIPYSELFANETSLDISNGKIIYGEYPQTKVDYELKKKLDYAIEGRDIFTTGKVYTSQSGYYSFPSENIEYRYNGEKFVRVHYSWFKVEPITWLVDIDTKLAISEKILVAGIKYDDKYEIINHFKKTNIKKYLDKYFANELYISQISLKEIERSEKNRLNYLKQIKYDITDQLLKLELINVKIKTEIFLNKTALSFELQETLDTIKLKEKELEDKIKEVDKKIADCTNEEIYDTKILTKRIS